MNQSSSTPIIANDPVAEIKTNKKFIPLYLVIIIIVAAFIIITVILLAISPIMNQNRDILPTLSPTSLITVTPSIRPTDNVQIDKTPEVSPSIIPSTSVADGLEYDLAPLRYKITLPKNWLIKKEYSFNDPKMPNFVYFTFSTIVNGHEESITFGKSNGSLGGDACIVGDEGKCYQRDYSFKFLNKDIKCDAALGFNNKEDVYKKEMIYELVYCNLDSISDASNFLKGEPLYLGNGASGISDVTLSSEAFRKILLSMRAY